MFRASMPVAAVYEDSDLRRPENQVCSTAKVWQRPRGHAVAQSLGVN